MHDIVADGSPLEGVYRVITKDMENDYFGEENDKNNSLVVPTSPIESFKQLEMSSRMTLLARKFSLGK